MPDATTPPCAGSPVTPVRGKRLPRSAKAQPRAAQRAGKRRDGQGRGGRAAKRTKGGGAESAPRPLLGKGQAITSYFARPEGQARLGGV